MLLSEQTQNHTSLSINPGSRIVRLACALILTLLLAAPENAAAYVEKPQDLATEMQRGDIDDQDITSAVERELLFDTQTSHTDIADIDVLTTEGVVTLDGSTDNILTRDRAERIAASVKGVRAVVNRITVRNTGRADRQIADDVLSALANDPATDAWEITADVSDGVVTLNGTVDSWQEKQLAAKVSESVTGVRNLINDITINSPSERPDAEIKEEVGQVLRWDARVDDALINVAVDQGNVTLTGTVGSAYEASLALNDAYVQGVSQVDATGLEINWDARDAMHRTEWASTLTESQIKNAVHDALRYDPRVSSFDVDIDVVAGTATLTGVVDNLKAKKAAAQDARNTVGVWLVENSLKVEPSAQQPDESVAGTIRARLMLDPYVERYKIIVDVDDGNAMLNGEVDSFFEKWQAGDVAARVPGVKTVENNLEVNTEPLPYDLTIYDWDPVTYNADYTPQEKSDAAIKDDVERELWWSPFVDQEEVNVAVKDGVVTLSGTVDTWAERTAAEEEAFEGGALGVENSIFVKYGPTDNGS